jgi:hypothetical protein
VPGEFLVDDDGALPLRSAGMRLFVGVSHTDR